MKIEQKKRWQNFGKHFLEVVSYIAYTVSVYYMSHTYIGKEFIADDKYRLFTFMFIGATFIYFKGNSIEIFKEMIKRFQDKSLELDFIIAPPRMGYYIKYSTDIYNIYLKY